MTRAQSQVSDRWTTANQRLHGALVPVAANRWWVTPNHKLHGLSPIEAWEAGNEPLVERVIADYFRPDFA